MEVERCFLSIPETCKMLGIHRSTLYRWIDVNYLHACYLNGRIKIPINELDRIIEEGQIEIAEKE